MSRNNLIERSRSSKILDHTVTLQERRDGIQRSEWVIVEGGETIGTIFTSRWEDKVSAIRNTDAREEKTYGILKYCMTKDQAFTALRRWLIAEHFNIGKEG